jgi:hypothetical protein
MNFKFNGILTTGNILSKINPIDIYRKYSDYFKKINSHFKSDFREDFKASAIVYFYNGTFLYRDFGEDFAMNCFQFVMRKFSISFTDAIIKINEDFNLGFTNIKHSFNNYFNNQQTVKKYTKELDFNTILTVKRTEFGPSNIKWWNDQSWTIDMLKIAKIDRISYFRLTSERKNIHNNLYACDNNSYTMDYYWHNGIFRRKIYQPENINFKWVSNVDTTIVQGWEILPKKGNILFIPSSYKDCGPFYRIYNKWCAIAPNTEASFIPENIFYKLKNRYKFIVLYYDNDDKGIEYAKKYSKMYKIKYIHNPIGSPKDPSDFWKAEGGRSFNYYLQKQLKNIINK